jgi:hypothetical protein
MNTQEESIESNAEDESFICTEPAVGLLVYDFLNDRLADQDARRFGKHVANCTYCQEEVYGWTCLFEAEEIKQEKVKGRSPRVMTVGGESHG